MQVDIRTFVNKPSEIVFTDARIKGQAVKLIHCSGNKVEPVWIDDKFEDVCIGICTQQDAENLIASLQLAVSLGWFNTVKE